MPMTLYDPTTRMNFIPSPPPQISVRHPIPSHHLPLCHTLCPLPNSTVERVSCVKSIPGLHWPRVLPQLAWQSELHGYALPRAPVQLCMWEINDNQCVCQCDSVSEFEKWACPMHRHMNVNMYSVQISMLCTRLQTNVCNEQSFFCQGVRRVCPKPDVH